MPTLTFPNIKRQIARELLRFFVGFGLKETFSFAFNITGIPQPFSANFVSGVGVPFYDKAWRQVKHSLRHKDEVDHLMLFQKLRAANFSEQDARQLIYLRWPKAKTLLDQDGHDYDANELAEVLDCPEVAAGLMLDVYNWPTQIALAISFTNIVGITLVGITTLYFPNLFILNDLLLQRIQNGILAQAIARISEAALPRIIASVATANFWKNPTEKNFEKMALAERITKSNKKILEDKLPDNLLKNLESCIMKTIPPLPVITPSGQLLGLYEALNEINGGRFQVLSWKENVSLNREDLRHAIQLRRLLNTLAELFNPLSKAATKNLVDLLKILATQMKCSDTGRKLTDLTKEENIFITKNGLFIIGKKVATQRDIKDKDGNYLVSDMQSDFFKDLETKVIIPHLEKIPQGMKRWDENFPELNEDQGELNTLRTI